MFDQAVTFLYTGDLAVSARFYRDVLGLRQVLDQGACLIFETAPGRAYLGVCDHRGAPADPGSVIVTLVTHDVDGWYERVTARGAAVDRPPADNARFNIRHFFMTDPAGYKIEVQQFRDPAWPGPGKDGETDVE